MTTDPLTGFYLSVLEQIEKRKDQGDFLRLLQDHEPGLGYRLSSEAPGLESLFSFGSRNPVIAHVEERRAAVVVSNRDLLGVERLQRPRFGNQCVESLMVQLREQLVPQPPPPSPETDLDHNPMWDESTTNKHHETLASRTFVRNNGGRHRSLLQDRLTATVAIPDLRLVVFAALVWERITATD